MFAVFGVGYSFGAFFESMSEEFDAGNGATALVFSITIALSFLLAPLTGSLADRFGPRPVLWIGAGSLFVGLLATSATPSLVLGYVTYGAGVGLAIACGYVPMVATVGGWFERRRSMAMGIAVAGIGLGTLVGSPLSARLIAATSWRTTFVIYAFGGGALLLLASVPAAFGPAAQPSARRRPLRELMALRDFRLLYVSMLAVTMGLFVPFVFLVKYAEDRGVNAVTAAGLVGLIGGSSVIGRLALGSLADRFGAMSLFGWSIATMTGSHLIWLVAGDRLWAMVVYAVVLGLGYGGFIALSPAVVAARFGLEGLGGILGTLYTSAAFGSFFGPPLAGLLIDRSGYEAAVSAATGTSAIGLALLSRLRRDRPRVMGGSET